MVISIDARKSLEKVEYPLMIKTLSKLGNRRELSQPNKRQQWNPTANMILSGKINAFPIRWEIRQKRPLSPIILNIILEVLTSEVRPEKLIKGIKTAKEETELWLFADDYHHKIFRVTNINKWI